MRLAHSEHAPWHNLLTVHNAFQGRYYHVQLTDKNTEARLSEVTGGEQELESSSSYLTRVASVC